VSVSAEYSFVVGQNASSDCSLVLRHRASRLTSPQFRGPRGSRFASPYAIMGEGSADTVLRGKVTKVDIKQISQSLGTGLSEEVGYTVTMDWEWVDMRTGKAIVARNGFASSGVVVASRPQAEPLDLARYGAVQRLADDIVANMQADW